MIHTYKLFILPILFCLWTAMLWAQDIQPNYTLRDIETGAQKTYVAWDFITMKPGFSYKASTGTSFQAKIQTGIPATPTSNTYAEPDGTITANPAEGGIVGSIPGQFSVNGNGAATYSIPIECPAGINGMKPSISLVYNSQSGDGPLGVGWRIDGISSITKTTKNIFADNILSGIDKESDAFQLDGNRLFVKEYSTTNNLPIQRGGVPFSTAPGPLGDYMEITYYDLLYTAPGDTYETQVKNYSQISTYGAIPFLTITQTTSSTHWISKSMNPRYFVVTTKSGTIMEYSPKNEIPIVLDETDVTYEWLVSRITDLNGNYMTFTYQTSAGQSVIKEIDYTGNGSQLPFASIVFSYDVKTTEKRTRCGNITKEDKYILNNIRIVSNNTTLKQYDLSYSIRKGKNYLEAIKLTGQNGTSLNSTTFAWGVDNDIISANTTPAPEPSYFNTPPDKSDIYWFAADMDGDGKDEVINVYKVRPSGSPKDYVQIFSPSVDLNTGKISLGQGDFYDLGKGLSLDNLKSLNPSILIGDINGDGTKEIIKPEIIESTLKFEVAGNTSIDHTVPATQLPVCAVADINNDGIDEIIYIQSGSENGEICYTKNDHTKIWVPFSVGFSPECIIPDDVDNDGLADLILVDQSGNHVYHNNGNSGIATNYAPVTFQEYGSLGNFNSTQKIEKGDFDDDGLTDFIVSSYSSYKTWTVILGNGESAYTFESDNGGSDLYRIENIDCMVTDFNHDGKSDVIIINKISDTSNNYLQTIATWYVSNGAGFDVAKTVTSTDPDYSFRKYNCTGDFDGDGREDVLSYGSDIYNGGNKSDNVFIQRAFNTNFAANHITAITDGLGKTTQITYQPLTYTSTPDNKPFYTRGSGSVYPVADMQLPLYCVSKASEPDGQGGQNTTEFAYSEARAQLTGAGFLGFKTRTISNAVTNRKIVTTTDINPTYYLPDKETTDVSTVGGTAVSKTEKSYTNSKTSNILLSQPTQTVESDYLNDLYETTSYVSFDAYGNATSVKTTQGDLITTQNSTYVQKGSWCPNKPETVTVIREQGSDSQTRVSNYTYDNATGNLTKIISDMGDENQKTVEYKDWTAFGQPTKTETTANGITRSTTMGISTNGRFVNSRANVLGQTVAYNWNSTTGLLDSETNRLGTTSYAYNGFGQLTRTDYPDGTYNEQTAQWASPDNGFGAKFYVYQRSAGSAPTYTWFDGLQRETVKEAYGLNGKKSRVFTQYRADGKTSQVSAPTFGSEPTAWDAEYDYYSDGRVHTLTTPTGTSTTTYSGKTTTVTTPEGTSQTVLNSAGQTATSTVNGKTVTYTYWGSGQVKTATPDGGTAVSMAYDLQGNRISLTDPDAGITTAHYNGLGELNWEKLTNNSTRGEITTTYNYNATTGQLETRVRGNGTNDETTNYGYDTNKRLITLEIAGQHKQTYVYGDYDRVTGLTEVINGTKTLAKAFGYDGYGRVTRETFPTGYYTENHYDDYGNLTEVTDRDSRSVWKTTQANARGQLTNLLKGTKETVYGYDENKGQLTSMVVPGVVNYSYGYDTKNNLEYRSDNLIAQKEHFSYDLQNRLTNWDIMNSTTNAVLKPNSITYDANTGNITGKSDLNIPNAVTLNYEKPTNPHALTTISPQTSAISPDELAVTYTDFRKIKTLYENGKNYSINYGVDDQRRMATYTYMGYTKTRYYLGDYEEETDIAGNVKKIHYLSGGAVYILSSHPSGEAEGALYYGYTDNQGSLIALTDQNGTVVEKYAYDPWGARRNPTDWRLKDARTGWINNRGYTGHEHLDMFSIINMNGRVYDPLTAMFFSPDPFIQAGGDWKNYNRYSYCMNNPTRYTDPSGYKLYNYGVIDDMNSSLLSSANGGRSGFGAYSRTWDEQHQGSISYDWDTEQYEYANGEEASTDAAMKQLYNLYKPEDRQSYSGSALGYDHLYTLTFSDGSMKLAGSLGGEITGINNGSFTVTNNAYSDVLAVNGEVAAWGKIPLSDLDSHYGSDGSYNLYTQNELKQAHDFYLSLAVGLIAGEFLGAYNIAGKVGSSITKRGVNAAIQASKFQIYRGISYLGSKTLNAFLANVIGGGIDGAIKYKYDAPPDPDMPYLINNPVWQLSSDATNNMLYLFNYK